MWFIWEACGIACIIITYLTVLVVGMAFIRVGIWEELLEGKTSAFIHLGIFTYHCVLIFISHFKCMTSEPGLLPMKQDKLRLNLMHEQVKDLYFEVNEFALKVKEDEAKLEVISDDSSDFSYGEEEPDCKIFKIINFQSGGRKGKARCQK